MTKEPDLLEDFKAYQLVEVIHKDESSNIVIDEDDHDQQRKLREEHRKDPSKIKPKQCKYSLKKENSRDMQRINIVVLESEDFVKEKEDQKSAEDDSKPDNQDEPVKSRKPIKAKRFSDDEDDPDKLQGEPN